MLTRLAVEFVIIFFVLSGFSIAHSLSNSKSPRQFYKRRFIRIYPSYVVALVWAGLVFVATYFWHPEWYDGSMTRFAFVRTNEMNTYMERGVVLKNLIYMPSRGFVTPFWSLTYEIIFYILAPFLLRKINAYAIVSFILFLLPFFVPEQLQAIGMPTYIYEFLFTFNVYFAVGVILYKNLDTALGWLGSITKKTMLAGLSLLVIIMYGVNFYFRIETVYSFIVSAMLSVVLILYFLKYMVRIPWLMNVGKFSYTLYITHFATIFLYLGIYWWLAKPSVPYILNYFVWMPAVGLVLLVAWVQYQLIEKRTKNILNFIRSKSKTTAT